MVDLMSLDFNTKAFPKLMAAQKAENPAEVVDGVLTEHFDSILKSVNANMPTTKFLTGDKLTVHDFRFSYIFVSIVKNPHNP
eukprot:CAMPEP_0170500854 /NCGR_PEP_ID=MMETSP0208-20121228/36322_1 /TAXON_ID=197538 /ORGANISM="Strombidium inclinatum, Strain S3" /LENGTH=81 /DNA_ID=CAMNT_0010779089 /DNA_START=1 /DNA_END=242 /DNA_ORIENTATION=+